MEVTAWSNGGTGLGVKVGEADRDQWFKRDWQVVRVQLGQDGPVAEVNVGKASFWGGCRELIHKEIGAWLKANGLAPWPKGTPPKLVLEPVGEDLFLLRLR